MGISNSCYSEYQSQSYDYSSSSQCEESEENYQQQEEYSNSENYQENCYDDGSRNSFFSNFFGGGDQQSGDDCEDVIEEINLDDCVDEAVETPVVETPAEECTYDEVVETPVVETPVVETPVEEECVDEVVETPVVETPVVETPVEEECVDEVVETPVVETPVVETPVEEECVDEVVETPVVETPAEECTYDEVIETPVVETPVVETPVEECTYDVVETVNPNTQVYLDELSKLENGSTDCADENLSLILQECQDNGVSAQSAIDFLKRYDAIEADENGYPVFSAKGETLNHYLKQLLDQDYMLEVQDEENAVDGQVAYIYQDMINAGLNPVRSLNNLIHQDLVEVSDAGQILPTETLIGLNLELPSDSLVA